MKLLWRNLWLADGSGSPLRRRCVLTDGDEVVAVEPEITASAADRTVEIDGKILAPGFLDVHSHSDLSILARPEGFGKISQGVTGEVVGNCGLSPFPITPRNREHLQQLWRKNGVEITWDDCAGYLGELRRRGVRLRITPLCGHNTLRAAVAGYEQRELSGKQLEEMEQLLETALRQGAAGLSTGLLYVPGEFATDEELFRLLRAVQRHNALHATHLRSEGDRLLESLESTLETARRAGLERLQISHFKTAGAANWGKLDAAIMLLEAARNGGMKLFVDRYPYTESMTQLSVILPGKWSSLDDSALMRRLETPEEAVRLEQELTDSRSTDSWRTVRLIGTAAPAFQRYAGWTFDRIAAAENQPPAAVAVRILAADATGAGAGFRGMSEENLSRILALDWCVCGSDENARPADDSIGRGHPRAFGSFPRFLRMRLDAGESIESAVRRLTALPAEIFQRERQGRIAPGFHADFAAFDPDTINSSADFLSPHTPAEGILLTAIGGEIIYRP